MAIFHGTIRSEALKMDTQLYVILPWDRPAENQPAPCNVLYLLHGLGDNAAAWSRYTSVERYAREFGLAVVMPEVQRGFYRDMAHGLNYFAYIAQELPVLCGEMFGLSRERRHNYIAGLSMGGYGALKCGLTHPAQYAGCASFSGVLDIRDRVHEPGDLLPQTELQGIMGMDLKVEDADDLMYLATKVSALDRRDQPELFITCGTEDFLYDSNTRFIDHLKQNCSIQYTYHEWQGIHEWGFWDKSLQMAMAFFFGE